ncbi:MAG: ATP-dependent DNA helicase RecG [Chloroflexi bacterium]|nr:ATP-dependent DNA helicase RecG [Chloroflexota bacterium]
MTTGMAQQKDPKAPSWPELLKKFLEEEGRRGYADRTVTGGLDRFLERVARGAEGTEALWQRLDQAGVWGVRYKALSPAERAVWATRTLEALGEVEGTSAPPAKAASVGGGGRVARSPSPMPKGLSLDSPITVVPGVGPVVATGFSKAGVARIRDLLYFFPRRHVPVTPVAHLNGGEEVGVLANVWEVRTVRLGQRQMEATEAVVGDETGNLRVVWFNQPFVARTVRANDRLFVSGYLRVFNGRLTLEAQGYEVVEGEDPLFRPGKLIPVYPSVRRVTAAGEGREARAPKRHGQGGDYLSPRTVRRVVRRALEVWLPRLQDFVPPEVSERAGLAPLAAALLTYHYPEDVAAQEEARRRLAFDELFLVQLTMLRRKRDWQAVKGTPAVRVDSRVVESFVGSLPFDLTRAQRTALAEVLADLEQPRPMARLLQGEVGSGKTVVALAAMLAVAAAGHQAAMMAPTEILAEQHFLTVSRLLGGLAEPANGTQGLRVRLPSLEWPLQVGLLIGSLPKAGREQVQRGLVEGEISILVGTHALIQEGVAIPRLALAVVDEQHRFGVVQRRLLRGKGSRPHLLAMSATPIPRSLALTLYGDLDLSVLDELPAGRQPIRTRWLGPEERPRAYTFVRQQVGAGRQAFIICPLVRESEALQARAAEEEFARLSAEVFKDLRLGLLHGQMPLQQKQGVMAQFRDGTIDVLVATPVVEVGVDVPNATVMLIESAERFGLAELHQFRGRVGRGQYPGFCVLLSDDPSPEAQERLKVLEREQDGFKIAEADLALRGPGEVLGTRQSGLPDLRVARLSDQELLSLARQEAVRLLESDPDLQRPEHTALRQEVAPLLQAAVQEAEVS